jgi:hypothetical protein
MTLVSIQLGYKDSAWFAANPTLELKEGQVVFLQQTGQFKIGDGSSQLQSLSFLGGTGGAVWGGITGTLSDQTDLQAALNAKQNTITTGTPVQYFRGDLSLAQFPTNLSDFSNDVGYLVSNQNITMFGDVSGSGATNILTSISNSTVTGKLLTGLSITGGSISPVDDILTAFGKVQNQINGVLGGAMYQGVWNALANSPSLSSGSGTQGYYYVVSVAGSTNLDGITDWKIGDWAIFNGTAWDKVDNTDAVSSVNGAIGAVTITTTGTSNRITVSGGGGLAPTIDISSSYVGQSSITTVGTITTGTWQGTLVSPTYGGTGVNNGSSTITVGGNVTFSGAYTFSGTLTANTSVTFPTAGTLITASSNDTLTNKSGNISQWTNDSGYTTIGSIFDITGSGQWFGIFGHSKSSASTLAGTIFYAPILIGRGRYVTDIGVDVQTGVGGGTIRMAIFSDSNHNPGTLIAESTAVAATSSGLKTFTFSSAQFLSSNTLYWLAVQTSSNSIALRTVLKVNWLLPNGGVLNNFGADTIANEAWAYGAFPTTAASGSMTSNSTTPVIMLKNQ